MREQNNCRMARGTLSDRLQSLRRERGVTQVGAAVAVGISRSYLGGLETGQALPGRATMVALADYYGVALEWLTSGEGERDQPPLSANEVKLLRAYRQLPQDEADAHLELLLRRAESEKRRTDSPVAEDKRTASVKVLKKFR
jgi:transcriptional regulator with XRE-family HTH domain